MSGLSAETRALLAREGLAPRKRFGQHFLVDEGVIERMVALAALSERDAVLEIGPGVGALTDVLATRAARLYVIEVDRGLCGVLRRKYAGDPGVRIVEGDALRIDLRGAVTEGSAKVVASLPYNVAVPILFRLLEERAIFPELTVMVQHEIAARLAARPGTRAYGAPSVLFQLYAEVTGGFRVPAAAFYPRPQVASDVLRIRVSPEPRVPVADPTLLGEVVRAAFGQRRKMLRNALGASGLPLPPAAWEAVFAAAGIDGRVRAETLDLTAFAALADAVTAHVPGTRVRPPARRRR